MVLNKLLELSKHIVGFFSPHDVHEEEKRQGGGGLSIKLQGHLLINFVKIKRDRVR